MKQDDLKLVLEALKFCHGGEPCGTAEAIVVVEKALAQPEQEPVAWRTFDGEGGYDYRSYEDNESYADDWSKRNPNHAGWVDKLYTHSQPEQEPVGYWKEHAQGMQRDYDSLLADYEKLTQPEQEPVAWMNEEMDYIFFDTERPEPFAFDFWKPLYTTPPQRPWVGLTEQQRNDIENDFEVVVSKHVFDAIEAKLRSKNGY